MLGSSLLRGPVLLIQGAEMISKVTLEYFKKFDKEQFDLEDTIVLAGPNNSGKSTLLQAIAVWSLAVQRCLQERGSATVLPCFARTAYTDTTPHWLLFTPLSFYRFVLYATCDFSPATLVLR
jgi:hypothetical protein